MTLQQTRQAYYLQDLFTLCEGWLYQALLPGSLPGQGGFAARAQALQQVCGAALAQNTLPPQPLWLNDWLAEVLPTGRVAGLHTPLLHLPQDCLRWGWQERRLRACAGDRPALEVLAAALCAQPQAPVTDCVQELAAWHRVVALCLAAQLQYQDSRDAAGTCRALITLLAGKTPADGRRSTTLLARMNTHCADVRGKTIKDETEQLSRWGNSFTLLQLVYSAKADRCALQQTDEDEGTLPASVLRTHKKPDIAKVAALWKLTAMEPGEWSRLTGDGYQWLQDTRTEDLMPLLRRYGEKQTAYTMPEEELEQADPDAAVQPVDAGSAVPESPASADDAPGKFVPVLDYCYYTGDPHFAPIVMARWKDESQINWDGGFDPVPQPAEWFMQGGTRAHLLMGRYTDCCNALGHQANQPYYSPAVLQSFEQVIAAAGDRWEAVPVKFGEPKVKAPAKAPTRFDLVKLFGAKPGRTACSRFAQGLWRCFCAAVPGWQPDEAGLAQLHDWLDELLCPNAVWQGFAQEAFAENADEAAPPDAFVQAVWEYGCSRYAAQPEWTAAYVSYKGKQAAWVFTVPTQK